jgi:hypothetical protein
MFSLKSRLIAHRVMVAQGLALAGLLAAAAWSLSGCSSALTLSRTSTPSFSFAAAADMRQFTGPRHPGPAFFEGACAALLAAGPGDFMVSPGDIDPPAPIRATLDRFFGSNYVWYPVVGNHDAESAEGMAWLRAWGRGDIPGLVRRGPPGCDTTTYSFDRGQAHFVVLNQYFDGRSDTGASGDVAEALRLWLEDDLAANRKPLVFVIGHEPMTALPDMDNGRVRHRGDSLDQHPANNRRFEEVLRLHRVTAYLCAHTHNTSITNMAGLWQIDVGHARGRGDKGARSTFMKFHVNGKKCRVEIYRDDSQGGPYQLVKGAALN